MAKPFNISVQGMNKLQNRLKTAQGKLKKEIGGELKDSADRINRKQLRRVPVDEGGLKQANVVRKNHDLEHELLNSKLYAPFEEFGTKSRVKIPPELASYAAQYRQSGPKIGFEEFLKIITAWVRRKGIAGRYSVKTRRRVGGKTQQANEDASVAYPIALKILREGVNPHPFFFAPYLEERPKIVERVKKLLNDI